MSYLIQSLTGDAKRSIKGLSHDWNGYVAGLKRLKLLFGQKSSIVHAHVDTFLRHQTVEDSDTNGLTTFYYKLTDSITSLLRLDYLSEIYSSDLLGRIVRKLPPYLRTKWSEYAWKFRSNKKEPNLFHLES